MHTHHLPATILLGSGALESLPRHLARLPGQKVLLVTDPGVVELGIAARVEELLQQGGREVTVFAGVSADPTVTQVSEGIKTLVDCQCNLVVAVGGGSPIDCAKAIALVARTGALEGRRDARQVDSTRVPLVAIPTTAGTGSEATRYLVITDPETGTKMALTDAASIPQVAVCDAELTRSLPPRVTAHTGMDALAHAMESFLSCHSSPFSDALAAQAASLVTRFLARAVEQGQEDMEAREGMMEAQLLAGISFSNSGLGYVHALAHALGARVHLPHGLANALMLPYVLEFIGPQVSGKLAGLAWAFPAHDPALPAPAAARRVVREIKNLSGRVGIPANLKEIGADRELLPQLAAEAARDPVAGGSPCVLSQEDLLHIFQQAWAGETG